MQLKCRICNSNEVIELGVYKPYIDYECVVYDCLNCGCRFVDYDTSIYEQLHASRDSSYAYHEELAFQTKEYFQTSDIKIIRNFICGRSAKFKFIIETLDKFFEKKSDHNSQTFKLLEIGCSKGYLTSYFIKAKQYQVLGVDISPSAINVATELFGNYFVTPESPKVEKMKPYDAIYHVGTIGCVESPVEMTKYLLSFLRPGGILVFNSPNVDACKELSQIWVSGTSPPDLVTLFSRQFWQEYFHNIADVEVITTKADGYTNIRIAMNQLRGISYIKKPCNKLLEYNNSTINNSILKNSTPKFFKYPLKNALNILGSVFFRKNSSEFGMYVVMKKK